MDKVEVGYVARAHGLRGEVRVHLHAPESTTLLHVETIFLDGQPRRIAAARPTNGAVLLFLEGVDDRAAAEALKGSTVEVERSAIELGEGEYLLGDLIDCAVIDMAGRELGRIVEILHGAQPILVIHDAETELMLPAVSEFIREVDTAARRVVVEPPEDLPVEPLRR